MGCRFKAMVLGCLLGGLGLSAWGTPPIRFVRNDVGGGGDGQSWSTAYNDLQMAIEAVAGLGGGQVWVRRGIYKPSGTPNPIDPGTSAARAKHFALRNNVEVYGGFAGTENPATFDLGNRDLAANPTILSGDVDDNDADLDGDGFPDDATTADNLCNIFWMPYNWGVVGAILDGFTLTGGNDDEGTYQAGGAILIENSAAIIRNCVFRWNQANSGGAILAGASADRFENCRFFANRSRTQWSGGGAIRFWNFAGRGGTPLVADCQFAGNRADDHGGALAVLDSSLTIRRCDFTGNQAGTPGVGGEGGGAFYVRRTFAGDAAAAIRIFDSTFDGNRALARDGGAGHISRDGGALGTLTATIWNSTFHGNQAADYGGALHAFNSTFDLVNLTVVDNASSADFHGLQGGGGLHVSASPTTVVNSLFWGNRQLTDGQVSSLAGGADLDVRHCVVEWGWEGGVAVVDADPQLDPAGLADHGGPTRTIALAGLSPALGLGVATGLPAGVDIANDQRGLPRHQSRGVDAGAYQVQDELPVVTFLAGPGGTVDGLPEKSVLVFPGQSTPEVAALPSPTHYFRRWTVAGVPYSEANPVTVVGVLADLVLTAEFLPKWRLRFATDGTPGAILEGETEQYVMPGQSGTPVLAVPPASHTFTHWRRGAAFFSDANPLTLLDVLADHDLVAEFLPYQVVHVAHDAGGVNDGSSWADAYVDLQDGIERAAAIAALAAPGQTISVWVKHGVYKPAGLPNGMPGGGVPAARGVHFALRNQVAVFGGFAGDEDPATFDLADRDFAAHETILSGDLAGDDAIAADGHLDPATLADNALHVFYHHADTDRARVDGSAVLDGFTLTGGNADLGIWAAGGAMLNLSSPPTVRHCWFRHNRALDMAGAVMFSAEYPDTASAGTFADCRFEANTAEFSCGAVAMSGRSDVHLQTRFERCVFVANRARQGSAGALNLFRTGGELVDCHFVGNVASSVGGALSLDDTGQTPVIIDGCTFEANQAGSGGAFAGPRNAQALIWNSTFWGNRARHQGGALYINNSDVRLVNVTIAMNEVEASAFSPGGGIHVGGSGLAVVNSILWGNRRGDGEPNQIDGGPDEVAHSVVEGGWEGGIQVVDADPLLDPAGLADNGGPTPTVALTGIGAALGLGRANNLPAGVDLAVDQRNQLRNQSRGIDAGAYQLQTEVHTVGFVAGAGGTVDGQASLAIRVLPGQDAGPVAAQPAATHFFRRWLRDGIPFATDNPLTVVGVLADTTLMALFAPKPRVTFATDDTPGATLDGQAEQFVEPGGDATPVEAVAPATHTFVHWTRDDALFSTDNPLTVVGVLADLHLVAVFAPKLRVTFATDDTPGATLDGQAEQFVEPGGDATPVKAVAPSTHYFVRWTREEAPFSLDNPLTVFGVLADLHLVAEFAQLEHVFVAADAAGDGSGHNWANACTDLQVGIEKAAAVAALGGRATPPVWVKAGLYRPSSLPNGAPDGMGAADPQARHCALRNGVEVYGGFAGTEDPATFDLGDRDFAAHETIVCGDLDDNDTDVDGDGFPDYDTLLDNLCHLFYHPYAKAVDASAVLDGFTLRGGHANSGDQRNGGAMLNVNSAPTVRHCRFVGNRASWSGGAVWTRDSGGGGTFVACHFEANWTSSDQDGGAISATDCDAIQFVDCRFVGNRASSLGGAVHLGQVQQADVRRCQFLDNRSRWGGGLSIWFCATTTLSECEFSGNQVLWDGGGLLAYSCDDIQILSCTFADNQANYGGGAIFRQGTQARLVNCTFDGNRALSQGGGIYLQEGNTKVSLLNVTLTGNHAGGNGGGLRRLHGTATVANSIAWGNTAGDPPEPSQLSPTNSIVVDRTIVEGTIDPSWTNAWNVDPLFDLAGLANHGGPVRTLALQAGSPAVDRGAGWLSDGEPAPATDARGVHRPQGNGIDLGAYEVDHGPTTAICFHNGWNSVAAPVDDWSPATVLAGLGLRLLAPPYTWQGSGLAAVAADAVFAAGTPVWLLVDGAPAGGASHDFGLAPTFAPAPGAVGTGWRLVGAGGNWPCWLRELGRTPAAPAAFVWSPTTQAYSTIRFDGTLGPGQAAWLYQLEP